MFHSIGENKKNNELLELYKYDDNITTMKNIIIDLFYNLSHKFMFKTTTINFAIYLLNLFIKVLVNRDNNICIKNNKYLQNMQNSYYDIYLFATVVLSISTKFIDSITIDISDLEKELKITFQPENIKEVEKIILNIIDNSNIVIMVPNLIKIEDFFDFNKLNTKDIIYLYTIIDFLFGIFSHCNIYNDCDLFYTNVLFIHYMICLFDLMRKDGRFELSFMLEKDIEIKTKNYENYLKKISIKTKIDENIIKSNINIYINKIHNILSTYIKEKLYNYDGIVKYFDKKIYNLNDIIKMLKTISLV